VVAQETSAEVHSLKVRVGRNRQRSTGSVRERDLLVVDHCRDGTDRG